MMTKTDVKNAERFLCNIYTQDRVVAEKKIEEILEKETALNIIKSENSISVETDFGRYRWVNPNSPTFGLGCTKAIVDERCTLKEYIHAILPNLWGDENDVEFF